MQRTQLSCQQVIHGLRRGSVHPERVLDSGILTPARSTYPIPPARAASLPPDCVTRHPPGRSEMTLRSYLSEQWARFRETRFRNVRCGGPPRPAPAALRQDQHLCIGALPQADSLRNVQHLPRLLTHMRTWTLWSLWPRLRNRHSRTARIALCNCCTPSLAGLDAWLLCGILLCCSWLCKWPA